jgi:hypothetical protein
MPISMQACKRKLQPVAFVVSILLTMQLFSSCQDFGVETSGSGPLLPLATGNAWKYLVYSSLPEPIDTLTVRIERQSVVEHAGILYGFWTWRAQLGDYPSDFGFLYRNDWKGLELMAVTAPNDTLLTFAPYLKCPVGVRESWEVPVVEFDSYAQRLVVTRRRKVECVDVKARIGTSAGEFSCIVYHWRERPEPDVLEEWDYYLEEGTLSILLRPLSAAP